MVGYDRVYPELLDLYEGREGCCQRRVTGAKFLVAMHSENVKEQSTVFSRLRIVNLTNMKGGRGIKMESSTFFSIMEFKIPNMTEKRCTNWNVGENAVVNLALSERSWQ